MTRTRYQKGSLELQRRANGDMVWVYRYRITNVNGARVQRKRVVGTLKSYPNESTAQKAVDLLRYEINKDKAPISAERTFGMLIDHFIENELADDNPDHAWSTKTSDRAYLRNWIRPQWADKRLTEVKTVPVEKWLRSLNLADGSKKKIRDIMSKLYTHCIRHEWLPMGHNPIKYVRQSGKRQSVPDILAVEEVHRLWTESAPRERAAISMAFGNGLRVSEAFALRIEDINFQNRSASVTKGIVKGHLGEVKTEPSKKAVPLTDEQIGDIRAWLAVAPYNKPADWLFASHINKGRLPYWNSEVLRDYIRPLAVKLGIKKTVGWHTFRRTFSSLLKDNGEDVKVVQELMRHGNPVTTMKDYVQAIPESLRRAQAKVVEMVRNTSQKKEENLPVATAGLTCLNVPTPDSAGNR